MRNLFRATALLLLLSAPAMAADLPVKAPVVAVWSWTGYYIGANIGYSWGHSSTDADFINSTNGALLATITRGFDMNGVIGGGQIGANWQSGNWVWGVEADFQASDQKGDTSFQCGPGICTTTTAVVAPLNVVDVLTFKQKLDWFATFRGRVGVTFSPVMAYVTGGAAVGHVKVNGTLTGYSAAAAVTGSFSDQDTTWGWTVGGGVEGRIAGNWTAKVEYLYIDFGTAETTASLPTNAPPLTVNFKSHITDNILRVGLNYKF
jgi:outer membrane immunogenic protein